MGTVQDTSGDSQNSSDFEQFMMPPEMLPDQKSQDEEGVEETAHSFEQAVEAVLQNHSLIEHETPATEKQKWEAFKNVGHTLLDFQLRIRSANKNIKHSIETKTLTDAKSILSNVEHMAQETLSKFSTSPLNELGTQTLRMVRYVVNTLRARAQNAIKAMEGQFANADEAVNDYLAFIDTYFDDMAKLFKNKDNVFTGSEPFNIQVLDGMFNVFKLPPMSVDQINAVYENSAGKVSENDLRTIEKNIFDKILVDEGEDLKAAIQENQTKARKLYTESAAEEDLVEGVKRNYEYWKNMTPQKLLRQRFRFRALRKLLKGEMTPEEMLEIYAKWKAMAPKGMLYPEIGPAEIPITLPSSSASTPESTS